MGTSSLSPSPDPMCWWDFSKKDRFLPGPAACATWERRCTDPRLDWTIPLSHHPASLLLSQPHPHSLWPPSQQQELAALGEPSPPGTLTSACSQPCNGTVVAGCPAPSISGARAAPLLHPR